MSETKSEIVDLLCIFRKLNPLMGLILFSFMYAITTVLKLDMPLEAKLFHLTALLTLYFIGAFFEFYRIKRQEETYIKRE